MQKILRYVNRKQWLYIAISIVFIVGQVWLDLKLPDYMAAITTLVETEGSAMGDILTQGGYMLLCALGSVVFSIIVGYLAAKVAAGVSKTLLLQALDNSHCGGLGNVQCFLQVLQFRLFSFGFVQFHKRTDLRYCQVIAAQSVIPVFF